MSIRHLPDDAVDKIKSSVAITSLNGVVCGLLTNSLDAGASKINISVDYPRGNCTIEDNGTGIAPDEFKEDGGLGKLHHTSRFPPKPTHHGKNGDFLASLATLSLLSISSRRQRHLSSSSVTFHHSRVLSRQVSVSADRTPIGFDYGTRVAVRDLFGSLPVRVKQRAALAERTVVDKEWARLVQGIVALLLAWPTQVNVSLKDTVSQRELRFRDSENSDMVSRTSRLFTQASLADSSVDSWIPISASSGSITVKGCFCVDPVATRRFQFISLGIHPVFNDYDTDVLYEEINQVFGNSSFGVIDRGEHQPQGPPKDGFGGKELRARKGIERWPMFYLRITNTSWVGPVDVDERLEARSGDLGSILDLLRALCYAFLKKNHFRPRKVRISPGESIFSVSKTLGRSTKVSKRLPASSSSLRSSSVARQFPEVPNGRSKSPFDGWDRVKVGTATLSSSSLRATPKSAQESRESPRRLVGEGGRLLRKPFDEPSNLEESGRDLVETDTTTETTPFAPVDLSSGEQGPAEKRRRLDANEKPLHSEWLQRVERAWTNPVFETAEPSVPRTTKDSGLPYQHGFPRCCGAKGSDGISFGTLSTNLSGKVSKEALARAVVVAQVDRKFILVKLPLDDTPSTKADGSTALIILDQHAVDERCRLEDLMAGYFEDQEVAGGLSPELELLKRQLVFEVSSKEFALLEQYREHFASWGIIYQLKSLAGPTQKECRVIVTSLPPSILERCRLEPRLLVEMLRKEVWRIVDEGLPARKRSPESRADKPWIANFHGCPQGILGMLNSRACRSAIMFNDVLTIDDCNKLVSRLAKCAFPFQCAHGRPSMAPLLDLGAGGTVGSWREDRKDCHDRGRWKRWMEQSES